MSKNGHKSNGNHKGVIIVGEPDVDPRSPSHVPGVHQGNWPGTLRGTSGIRGEEIDQATTSKRSTGINPEDRSPKRKGMPRLPPA